jgi:FeS assembly SUF system regulator
MLRMSKLADYGTVVMAYLASGPEQVRSALEISRAIGLELPTVGKILKTLVRANLLLSRRGVRGGYLLARAPRYISVAEIIDAIEGYPMGLTECSSVPGLCTRETSCAVRGNWQRVSRIVRATLEQMTLAELATPLPQAVDAGVVRHAAAGLREAGMEG